MTQNLKIIFVLLFFSIAQVNYAEQHNFEKNGVEYCWEKEPNHLESKKVFLDSFTECYDQIPLEILGVSSKEEMIEYLNNAFDDSYKGYKNSENSQWLSAKMDDKIVGFLIIDLTKQPEEIYLELLAIDPIYQGRGIASKLVDGVLDQFLDCKKFVLIN